MIFLNNISALSWQSVLLVEETGAPGEHNRPIANHWQTLSPNVYIQHTQFLMFNTILSIIPTFINVTICHSLTHPSTTFSTAIKKNLMLKSEHCTLQSYWLLLLTVRVLQLVFRLNVTIYNQYSLQEQVLYNVAVENVVLGWVSEWQIVTLMKVGIMDRIVLNIKNSLSFF
jgi:hypothetical protein